MKRSKNKLKKPQQPSAKIAKIAFALKLIYTPENVKAVTEDKNETRTYRGKKSWKPQ